MFIIRHDRQKCGHHIHLVKRRLRHTEDPHLSQHYQLDHKSRIDKQRPQRHIMRRKKGAEEQNHAHGDQPGMKGKDHARRRRNPFSPFEMQIKRKVMSQNSTRRRINLQQVYFIRMGILKEQVRQHDGQNTLHDIPQQNDKSRLRSQCPQRVRRTCIAAAVIPDVNAMQLSVKISRLKQSKYISDHQTYSSFHFYLFSFLSRMINLSGVPINPKVSRI